MAVVAWKRAQAFTRSLTTCRLRFPLCSGSFSNCFKLLAMSSTWLLMFLALGAATAKPLMRSAKVRPMEISSVGGTGALIKDQPHDDTCTMNEPCQRADGILSSDLSATTSTLTHCTVDVDPTQAHSGRWCGAFKNTNQQECEQEFSYKNCAHTNGKHSVYYPCLWDATRSKKCYAGAAYTAPSGVLLADGSVHAEVCDCTSGCSGGSTGVAADVLFGSEHCLTGETMNSANRCAAATTSGSGDGDGE